MINQISEKAISGHGVGLAAFGDSASLSREVRSQVIDDYLSAFYLSDENGGGIFATDSNKTAPTTLDFWREAEMIELLEDAVEQGSAAGRADLLERLYRGFIKLNGADWKWNLYNDDIIWITIACLRAYRITGNRMFYEKAKNSFDLVYARAATPSLGGGLLWHMERESKHACINGPAAIAALLLYQAGAGEDYYKKGKEIFEWEYKFLFHEDGSVSDNVGAGGELSEVVFSYNSGTFIGSADLLGIVERTSRYDDAALRAAVYVKKRLTGEILPEIMCNREHEGDGPGFHSIFFRWCGKWARRTGNAEILSWFAKNASAAVASANSAGLIWGAWGEKTPDGVVTSWEAANAVAVVQACL